MDKKSRSAYRTFTLIVAIWIFSLSSSAVAKLKASTTGGRLQQTAQGVRFTSGTSTSIPLDIDNNIIIMRVSVNRSKPLNFIFDTGASHTLINSTRATELGLRTEGQARGAGTGGAIRGNYIRGVTLSVQGAEVFNQFIVSVALPTFPGFEFDGIIGYDFINEFVVEIDYSSKLMNLHSPQAYRYTGKGEVIPISLKGLTPLARTRILIDGREPVEASLEVDTGADVTFVINSPFVKKNELLKSFNQSEQSGGVGVGGEQKLIVGRVKAVQLGRLNIPNPPVALSLDSKGSGASEQNDGLIGGEIFRRFKLILDYSRSQMILEPNKSFNDPYDLERKGD